MAYGLQPTGSYVKFVRGTQEAFNALANKPDDTLFFIYENNESTFGTLWLGDMQIGDGSTASLSDLISDVVGDGDLLVYNEDESKWEPLPIEDIVGVMQGATASNAGRAGLVPQPSAGDQNRFLRGDGTWASVSNSEITNIDEDQFELELDNSLSIKGFSSAAAGTVPQKSDNNDIVWTTPVTSQDVQTLISQASSLGVRRTIVENLEDAIEENYIYLKLKENNGASGNLYDEYMVVNGNLEKIGDASANLDLTGYVTTADLATALNDYTTQSSLSSTLGNYVTTTVFNSSVGNLQDLVHASGNSNSTIVEEINDINDRLQWQTIVNNGE